MLCDQVMESKRDSVVGVVEGYWVGLGWIRIYTRPLRLNSRGSEKLVTRGKFELSGFGWQERKSELAKYRQGSTGSAENENGLDRRARIL